MLLTKPFLSSFHQSSAVDRRPDQISGCEEKREQLIRLAALVAIGEAPFPADFEPQDLQIVLAEVARLRRRKLVRFVARAIAQDIHGDGRSK